MIKTIRAIEQRIEKKHHHAIGLFVVRDRARPLYTPMYFLQRRRFEIWCRMVKLWEQVFHPVAGVPAAIAEAFKKPHKRNEAAREKLRQEFLSIKPSVKGAVLHFRACIEAGILSDKAAEKVRNYLRRSRVCSKLASKPYWYYLKRIMVETSSYARLAPAQTTAKLMAARHKDPALESLLLHSKL